MVKVGVHLMVWTSTLGEDTLALFQKAKDMGYDGVEIPLIDPMNIKQDLVEKMRKELDRLHLECICAGGLVKSENLVDKDENIRKRGEMFLNRFIDLCSDLGSKSLGGPLYGTFGMTVGRRRTDWEWDFAVNSLRKAADYAKDKGITLCLEVLNRYETYFINIAQDGVNLVKDINRSNVKLHLDSYHMNIEEKDFYTPIINSKEYLGYFHCSENDRGIPGTGHVNWDEVFKGLSEINYSGWLGIESFCGPMDAAPVASSVWRKLADNIDDIPAQGLKFIRKKAGEYKL